MASRSRFSLPDLSQRQTIKMNSQRWPQIEELYYSALPLNQHERSQFIAKSCGSDSVLREEVNSLLEADESSGDFLERSMLQVGLQILVDSSLKSDETETGYGTDKPAADNFVGSTVDGRYEIVEKLGSGGVGDVYRARDRKVLFRTVVIKVLKDSSLSKPWIVAKFQQEIEALTKIADPGVVGIIDAGNLPDGKPYLAMELVKGCNLREFIQRNESGSGPLDLYEIAEIARQVGRTVTSAHDVGIIHRDLKPANIMVRRNASGDLQIKVIDFGIAKITGSVTADSTTTGLMAGTIQYMAPEQLRGQRVKPASDVYALGVITYEMVTGCRPFNPEGPALLPELQKAGVKVKPRDLRPGIPLGAQDAILKALSYHPADRYQRARDFGDAVADALAADDPVDEISAKQVIEIATAAPSRATGESLIEDQCKPPLLKRSFWKLALAMVALVFLVLIGAVSFSSWHPSSIIEPTRTLTYSLTVQKMREGKPYQEPFQSSGQEIFESGYRFRLNVTSHQPGYFYVFNEGATDTGDFSLTIIYPTPLANNGSAKIDSTQELQTDWNEFGGQAGTEQFWMIWSASPVSELEAVRDAAFKRDKGAVADSRLGRRVREFLLKHSEPKLETKKDTARQETTVRGRGDLLVKLVELEHR